MKYLLDTHTFLWWSGESQHLSHTAYELCQNAENVLFLSVASIWEIQIKVQLGKLNLPAELNRIVTVQQRQSEIRLLHIELPHIYNLDKLPLHHRDPFDRMIISQAMVEGLPIITADSQISKYPVEVVW